MKPWLVVLGTAFVYLVGQWLPLPGVDTGLLEQLGVRHVDQPHAIGNGIGLMVAMRFALIFAKDKQDAYRRIAFGVFVLLVSFQGLAMAFWLESLSFTGFYGEVVQSPGWAFKLTLVAAFGAGGALMWFLADQVGAKGRMSGSLLILSLDAIVRSPQDAFDLGEAFARLELSSAVVGLSLLGWLVLAVTVIVSLAKGPREFPHTLGGPISLRGNGDLIAAPFAAAMYGAVGLTPPAAILPDGLAGVSETIALLGSIAGPLCWIAALWKSMAKAAVLRGLLGCGLALIWLAAHFGPFALSFMSNHGFENRRSPFEGSQRCEVVLTSSDPGNQDADLILSRLQSLHVQAQVTDRTPNTIALSLENVGAVDTLLERIGRPGKIGFHPTGGLDVLQRFELPAGAGFDERLAGIRGTEESLAPLVGQQRGPWRLAVMPSIYEEEEGIELIALGPAELSNAELGDARVGFDPQEGSVVYLVWSDEGAQRFAQLTGAHVHERLAIVLDDEVLSAPVIQERIEGGSTRLTMAAGSEPTDALSDASALVAALQQREPLHGNWTVLSRDCH